MIRKISDSTTINMSSLAAKNNYDEFGIVTAGAGEWDLIGDEFVKSKSSIYPSHGGDYRVVFVQTEFGPYLYSLREHDPLFDDVVKNYSVSGKGTYEMIFRDISSYCDGDDGLAEFFLQKLTMMNVADYAQFWD